MEFNLPAAILAIVFFASLRGIFHAIRSGWILKPPAYEPPPNNMPRADETIEEYYTRMEKGMWQEFDENHAMDDATFSESPAAPKRSGGGFCTLRLNGMSESLDALAEKEGYGGRE